MQVAKYEWKQSWANYLASSRGWIVAQIDGRGSGGEGDRRRFEIWHHLGSVEVADQVCKTILIFCSIHNFHNSMTNVMKKAKKLCLSPIVITKARTLKSHCHAG